MRKLLLLGLLAAAAATATPAAASTIVYSCGVNLCAVGGDGAGARQLTTDGTEDGSYSSPSVSSDGTRLAFKVGARVFTADTALTARRAMTQRETPETFEAVLRPDGARVLWVDARGMFSNDSRAYNVFEADFDGLNLNGFADLSYPVTAGWSAAGEVLITDRFSQEVCVTDLSRSCLRTIAADTTRTFFCFDASPDGRFLAAGMTPSTGDGPKSVVLFDTATQQPVRELASTSTFACPSFSPDGTEVVYDDTDGLRTVPVAGGPARLIVPGGSSPSWGATPPPPAAPPQAPVPPAPAPSVSAPPARKAIGGKLTRPASVRAGRRFTVSFRAAQAVRNARVLLQRRSGRRFKTVRTVTQSGRTLRVRVRLRTRGVNVLRLVVKVKGRPDAVRTFRVRVR